ncbi:NADAR family protein [Rubinisphaera margarita]|uniref:NADAR family protein n=1 Tax=Rubinisphaera margarita TaxID=2909586 RepID=UPI001EE828BE|nr:NADAR family protein [Rubinisphaera margarita]MCG6156629.1 NADAR family protein [Rubinisphaera margarita]
MNLDSLQNECLAGERHKFLHFWGHQPRKTGVVDESCMSQWYPAGFNVEGILYPTAEHYMMAAKARLFDDRTTEQSILNSPHPGAAKKLGRQVSGFDEHLWEQSREQIVLDANRAKFSQHSLLLDFLLRTGARILVEASPHDRIWGIGLSARDAAAHDPLQWLGLNLLGFALMRVRDDLSLQQ